ncbi:ADP-ribosylglycohydrolase family protein [Streptomyces sp. CB01580]|uniref:ADP-ribosylglycohydrolase family protein n=1 Tax=Streptomyces sp. CB01580 TaxID=1703933 RepID=UPI0009607124|nr:ADP-ribosylglycohydrolase family protein [Streptomyces sp. CB01580]OKJ37178.1 crystallin [Streptomyces sp. CB01580]
MLRLTWVQPEDLIGHELRQAAQDGRDATGIAHRWVAAGGRPAPDRDGASARPVAPALRALAEELLDELARLPTPLAAAEPPPGPLPTVPPGPDAPRRTEPAPRGASRACGAVVARTELDRLHAAWLGRAVGCLLGKSVEKIPLPGIRAIGRSTGNWPLRTWFTERDLDPRIAAAHPWNRRSRPTSLAENIDGMPEDDDLDYPLLNLLLLRRHGHGFSTDDVARLWLEELPAGRTFTAERVAYRNLLAGLEPPLTATYRNPFREWIGAQIRADVFGWTNPGNPARAAELARRDAMLSHTANGVYGEMFVAAAIAHAAGPAPTTVHDTLTAALAHVPPNSRYAQAIRFGIETARAEPTGTPAGFDRVVDALHARYAPDHHWVHVLPNAALLAAALTHADGNFAGAVCRAVSGGWDTDSNGATAGSITGLLAGGPDALGEHWTAPLKNRLATGIGDFDGIGFDELARLTLEVRESEERA